ncbi:hypothetical protein GCM10027361_20540 [Erwinia aphidicola]
MLSFQRAQLRHQTVIFRIGDFGGIKHVVLVFVVAKLGSQMGELLLYGFHSGTIKDKKPPKTGVWEEFDYSGKLRGC